MKNLLRILICISFLLPMLLFAQVLETEKTTELSKDARKGYLGLFDYDDTAKEYTMVFVHEKNKKTVYVTYKFDYDFNQISVNEEELSLSQAAQKYDWIEYEEGEGSWTNPTVVRIDGTAFHAGQVVLRRGKITRK